MQYQELKIPQDFINRTAEREMFLELLQFTTEARLLAIEDREGTGKSTLLKMLRHLAFDISKKPVSIVSFEEPTINSPWALVERLRKGFATKWKFTTFDELNEARLRSYLPSRTTVSGTINAQGITLGGAGNELTGTKVVTSGDVVINPPSELNPEQQDFAKRKCIAAFFADLKSIGDATETVILLDSFELCNVDLKDWILEEFLSPLCFDADMRPQKLVLVLAGRELPNFAYKLDQATYEKSVRSRALSMWEEEHVKEFLRVHGCGDFNDMELGFVWTYVQKGVSIAAAISFARSIREIRTKAG